MNKSTMAILLTVLAPFIFGLDGCVLGGCVAHGSREVSVEFTGSGVVVKDIVHNDETGKPDYSVGFDEPFTEWLLTRPEEDTAQPVVPPTTPTPPG